MKTRITTPEALIMMFGPMTDDEFEAAWQKLAPGASDQMIRDRIEKWWQSGRLCRTKDDKVSIKVVLYDSLTFGDGDSLEKTAIVAGCLSVRGKIDPDETEDELMALAEIGPISIGLFNALPIQSSNKEVAMLTLLRAGRLAIGDGCYHLPGVEPS